MKHHKLIFLFCSLPILGLSQTTLTNNSTSVLLTPDGIEFSPSSPYANNNVGLGEDALKLNRGINNTALGISTLKSNETGENNTAVGSYSLLLSRLGSFNTSVGSNSQSFNVGQRNSSLGTFSLQSSTEANDLTAVGFESLKNNMASSNTAIGSLSLRNNVSGNQNTAVGFEALKNGISESHFSNTAIGHKSGMNNNSYFNTAVGALTLQNNLEGHENVAIGAHSLAFMNTSNWNIGIGSESLSGTADVSNCIGIGYRAGIDNANNYMLYIENSLSPDYRERPLISGIFDHQGETLGRKVGIDRAIANLHNRSETLQVHGEAYKTIGGGNCVTTSDRRFKKEIAPLNSAEILQKVLSLQGVNYEWKDEAKGKGVQYGFIAQDLQKVFPTKVQEDKKGFLSASYGDFDPFLVEAIKALNAELSLVKAELAEMKNYVNETKAVVSTKR